MKIAITTSGNNTESAVDSRFGRAEKFLIYETVSKTFSILDNNQNLNAAQGAGIQAAQNIIKTGAQVLITGHCGPKAFKVLNQAGVKIYTTDAPKINEALELYLNGSLKELSDADVEGHWN